MTTLLAAGAAQANDPHAATNVPAAGKPVKASAEAIVGAINHAVAKPAGASASASAAASAAGAAAGAPHEMTEDELNAKIQERIATMRARATAAARIQKVKSRPRNIEHWSYEGETGPAQWGKINTAWAKCGAGNRQSPIDIRDGIRVDLEPIAFDYKPSTFSVVDNGHTVQVALAGGNYITVGNRMYELVQFHFHRPSEERVNGRGFEMVAHLVHRDVEGKLAVIAVLIERGRAQQLIQTVWNNLPLEKLESATPNIVLDMNDLLPRRRDYYTFMGSLTTPPCTEGVLWMVMKEPIQASTDQLSLFARLYPLNARPVQPNGGRVIKESN